MWTNPCKMLKLLLKMKKSIQEHYIINKCHLDWLYIVLNTNEHSIWCLQLDRRVKFPLNC